MDLLILHAEMLASFVPVPEPNLAVLVVDVIHHPEIPMNE
jgi:hypothetical protein